MGKEGRGERGKDEDGNKWERERGGGEEEEGSVVRISHKIDVHNSLLEKFLLQYVAGNYFWPTNFLKNQRVIEYSL